MAEIQREDEGAQTVFGSKKFRVLLYSGVLLWIVLLLWWATDWTKPDDRRLPFLIGGILVVLLGLQLLDELWYDPTSYLSSLIQPRGDEAEIDDPQKEELKKQINQAISSYQSDRTEKEKERYERILLVWVIALPFLLHAFGFILVVPLYLFTFLWYFLNLKMSVIVTTIFCVLLYALFVRMLGVYFWRGVIDIPRLFF